MLSRLFQPRSTARGATARRRLLAWSALLLTIEFFDELVFGVREAAWPLLRTDLGLSYAQIGLLLGLPSLIANPIEVPLGLLADGRNRRVLVVGGGLLFAGALLLVSVSRSLPALLLAFIVLYPASGAFVTLSQATLMDLDPRRHEQGMARWVVAGLIGVVAGPLVLARALALGVGWRNLFRALAVASLVLALLVVRLPFARSSSREGADLRSAFAGARNALRRRDVVRWLILLQLSDLLFDGFLGFLALYFVDVVGVAPELAGTAVVVWTSAAFVGGLLLIPLLDRTPPLAHLRRCAVAMLFLFPLFLLLPSFQNKLVLLALLGAGNAAWYPILKGQLYSALPGQSGTVMAAKATAGMVGGLLPALLGMVAERFGLSAALWLIALVPLALLTGLSGLERGVDSSAASAP